MAVLEILVVGSLLLGGGTLIVRVGMELLVQQWKERMEQLIGDLCEGQCTISNMEWNVMLRQMRIQDMVIIRGQKSNLQNLLRADSIIISPASLDPIPFPGSFGEVEISIRNAEAFVSWTDPTLLEDSDWQKISQSVGKATVGSSVKVRKVTLQTPTMIQAFVEGTTDLDHCATASTFLPATDLNYPTTKQIADLVTNHVRPTLEERIASTTISPEQEETPLPDLPPRRVGPLRLLVRLVTLGIAQ
uniref:Uncharacterized protein n=1 Tax=Compsopogon caeruleus TaxID=31354 RepID=A0A6T6BFA9_9RHOD|mmetsp:Transcript_15826/g.31767  ORF Transcript_15826/g.31767 Transcript_15826/m.31767 type:complete len:246 (+) Transcript_15826:333-1070(+)|eukprot:CAMPEP_0184677968 /NCGR_PEP_ID=MMETSP0312-20130426/599_1 /TAXON_ID=31354 /ORGANISM="Compsopogon coeruleus, Strain SAG 36.94" /LENGTH=245 /DNA_ID=CAMNT_0027126249 /DNA_START=276 /DNA_END=1013 /DNA_ORIENTATION=+